MKSINFSDLIAISSLFCTAIGGLVASAFWYANNEKRKYGLERDFAHMKRNYEQIQHSLNMVLAEFDHRFDIVDKSLVEIKSLLTK